MWGESGVAVGSTAAWCSEQSSRDAETGRNRLGAALAKFKASIVDATWAVMV